MLLRLWRMEVQGEREAYWGFLNDKEMPLFEAPDGSKTLMMINADGTVMWKRTFQKSSIRRFVKFDKWFFDHFGAAEERFFGG